MIKYINAVTWLVLLYNYGRAYSTNVASSFPFPFRENLQLPKVKADGMHRKEHGPGKTLSLFLK